MPKILWFSEEIPEEIKTKKTLQHGFVILFVLMLFWEQPIIRIVMVVLWNFHFREGGFNTFLFS